MSRSRKKHAVVSDYSRNTTAYYKRIASKTVRKHKGPIPDGSYYKKLYCSWNIFDYKSRWDLSYIREFPDLFDEEELKRAYRK